MTLKVLIYAATAINIAFSWLAETKWIRPKLSYRMPDYLILWVLVCPFLMVIFMRWC